MDDNYKNKEFVKLKIKENNSNHYCLASDEIKSDVIFLIDVINYILAKYENDEHGYIISKVLIDEILKSTKVDFENNSEIQKLLSHVNENCDTELNEDMYDLFDSARKRYSEILNSITSDNSEFTLSMYGFTLNHLDRLEVNFDTVLIGKQLWTTENLNLNVDNFKKAENFEDWKKLFDCEEPSWCYYNFDDSNGNNYGKLYNWYALETLKKVLPDGWRIPTEDDWKNLVNTLGENNDAAFKLKSEIGWFKNQNGNNLSKFGAKPGGYMIGSSTEFYHEKTWGCWWSVNKNYWEVMCFQLSVNPENPINYTSITRHYAGLSIRLVKDND